MFESACLETLLTRPAARYRRSSRRGHGSRTFTLTPDQFLTRKRNQDEDGSGGNNRLTETLKEKKTQRVTSCRRLSTTDTVYHRPTVPQTHCATDPLCHRPTVPQTHCATDPLRHRPTAPQTHCTTDPQTHCATDPLYHRPTVPQTHRPTVPQTHRPTVPQTHCATDPQTHCATDPLCHRPTAPQTHCATDPLRHRPTVPRILRFPLEPAVELRAALMLRELSLDLL
ncbi:unnamed protein product [Pleuronectes platessa]|uniref:Uncharacterized protein n=1 Tax=Pleuronectes platessa TaxID=8262 RepID=A0A9N7V0D6_PLEPL|nr:unnamed protein product [Pleuronectes platessa]